MIGLVQRVQYVRLSVEGELVSSIGPGLLILLGVSTADTEADADWLAAKIAKLRIFSDDAGKMNLSLLDVQQEALVVSQFTLLADASQGNRPSYMAAARPEQAIPLYERFTREMEKLLGKKVPTGVFGADMKIELLNDGPVTLHIDSQIRHKSAKG